MDLLAIVASLVTNHKQPIDVAWKFTLREFLAVAGYNRTAHGGAGWDHERVDGLQEHLKNLGVID